MLQLLNKAKVPFYAFPSAAAIQFKLHSLQLRCSRYISRNALSVSLRALLLPPSLIKKQNAGHLWHFWQQICLKYCCTWATEAGEGTTLMKSWRLHNTNPSAWWNLVSPCPAAKVRSMVLTSHSLKSLLKWQRCYFDVPVTLTNVAKMR